MYCSKCGKENQEDARFCMHCGADLSEYKVEVAPKIVVSPKISVSAKAEGGVALKWKQKPEKYVEIKGKGKLPVFKRFIPGSGGEAIDPTCILYNSERFYCPQCGNYGALVKGKENPVYEYYKESWGKLFERRYYLYKCQACEKLSLQYDHFKAPVTPYKYVYLDFKNIGEVPIYYLFAPICPICGADEPEIVYPDLYRNRTNSGHDVVYEIEDVGGAVVRYDYDKYNLYKCPVCQFQYLCSQHRDEECREGTTHEDYFHPICELCENHKAEYTCSSCGKRICENCVVKKGLLSKRYLCPNCK